MPESKPLVYAEIVLRARTGASLLADIHKLRSDTLQLFRAPEDAPKAVSDKLKTAGFQILAQSEFGVSIAGPQKLLLDFFKTRIMERPVDMLVGAPAQALTTNAYFMADTPHIPDNVAPQVESVYIPRKGYYLSGEGPMPNPAYYHLSPPADISHLTNADHAHSRGYYGAGVKAAIVDSGFIASHDYYAGKGYNLTVHPVIGSATVDEVGHGTGIASNLLAIAPKCEFHLFKMSDGYNWASLAAFRAARLAGMQVISCSWGQGFDPVLEAEIIAAVHTYNIVVVFAAGNGGPVGWPGCMPDVISAGGAFPLQGGGWTASTYASSGVNSIYPARHSPDVSGMVGQAPKGIFIMMPTMKGAQFDGLFSGGVFPNGDQTGPADGWLCASGTSSAAPQIAGEAAVLIGAKAGQTPADIKLVIEKTSIDVTAGSSASGEVAGVGPDSATGAGVIDVGAAIDAVVPVHICGVAPVVACGKLPVLVCKTGPSLCKTAPSIICKTGPAVLCKLAPLVIKCPPGPVIASCPPGPVVGCLAGPSEIEKPQLGDPVERRMTPVVVMVDEAQAERLKAAAAGVGVTGEFAGFPETETPAPGGFAPKVGPAKPR